MPLNVNLTPQLEELVRRKVSSGRYNSASEVVREALRIMEAQDELQSLKLEQLRRDIRDGLNSGPARPWSVAEMKREGRKRLELPVAPQLSKCPQFSCARAPWTISWRFGPISPSTVPNEQTLSSIS